MYESVIVSTPTTTVQHDQPVISSQCVSCVYFSLQPFSLPSHYYRTNNPVIYNNWSHLALSCLAISSSDNTGIEPPYYVTSVRERTTYLLFCSVFIVSTSKLNETDETILPPSGSIILGWREHCSWYTCGRESFRQRVHLQLQIDTNTFGRPFDW